MCYVNENELTIVLTQGQNHYEKQSKRYGDYF